MNTSKKLQYAGIAALVSAGILAGCSGGGSKSSPIPTTPTTTQSLGAPVQTSLTFLIGGDATQTAGRAAKYVPASAQSIVVKYVGDNPSATPVPGGGTIPSSAITAATVNVNTAAGGNCTAVGSALRCTIGVSLPVGTLDLYIQAFTGQNGGGTLLASSVSVLQLTTAGTFVSPGTSTAATPAPLTANIAGAQASVTLPAAVAATSFVAPQVLPLSTSAPTSLTVGAGGLTAAAGFLAANAPFSYSPLQTPTFTNADGTALTGTQPISPVTITDTDTSGATCLVYVKQGATTATPCPQPSAGATSSVTLTNSQDAYAVQWNGKFLSRAGITITAAIPGSQATSTPAPQKVTPGLSTAIGPIAAGVTSNGSLVYDPVSSSVYIGTASNSKPLVQVPYTAAAGYGTAKTISVVNVNAASPAVTNLTGGFGSTTLTLGPDGNIWIAESSAAGVPQYVAVYAVNSTTANGKTGASLSPGTGVFSEYLLNGSGATAVLLGIANAGNYIWVTDNLNDAWRINPSSASINPNKAAAYIGTTANAAVPVTTAAAVALTGVFASNAISLAGSVWTMSSTGLLTKLTLDTSASPSAGVCSTAGPPPCIAAATQSAAALSAGTPFDIATDGTNIYATDTAGNFGTFSQAFALTKAPAAIAQGANWANGLGLGPDGVIWTNIKNNGGAEGLTTLAGGAGTDLLAATIAALPSAAPPGCQSAATTTGGGTTQFVIGPDGTLLFSPFGATATALCGIIY